MSSVLDRIKAMKEKQNNNNNNNGGSDKRTTGQWYKFKEGENKIRLVGDFIELRIHNIGKPYNGTYADGICKESAFEGDDRIPYNVVCNDWNVDTESAESEKTCPICEVHRKASMAVKISDNDEDIKGFKNIAKLTRPANRVVWNVLDRDNPNVTVTENGESNDVLGLKIAEMGPGIYGDILDIFKQTESDIADIETGVDIQIVKNKNESPANMYKASLIINGTSVKVTPLTDEERGLELYDLKTIKGRKSNIDTIIEHMNQDFLDVLGLDEEKLKEEVESLGK